jgi:hypothetical protein
MLYAYCDESYDGNLRTTPVYVVAGFIGELEQWEMFEALWRQSMKELRIRKVGCHAAKCAYGSGPYEHMSQKRRDEIQRRLIVDIAASRLFGVLSIMDTNAYRRIRPTMSARLKPKDRQYNEAHVLAVRQCAQHMCLVTEKVTTEPITFVVDQNERFGKRAKAWYEELASNQEDRHSRRFGPFAESDRMKAIGLQAADMLAYAGCRYANPEARTGWQWDAMKSGIRIDELTTDDEFWKEIERRFLEEAPNEK